ncbi:unnamed protein product [Leptosia nina]|uniref:Uncharacterized protein n=1 Tax=Leptosia nina TaxID=320188 RepID=A0AAV1JK63_9NEOP
MEGDGEVVLVHGLRDSALAITLLCGGQKRRHSLIGTKSPTRTVKSNVETNTRAQFTDSAVQIDCADFTKKYNTNYVTLSRPKWEHPQRSTVISLGKRTKSKSMRSLHRNNSKRKKRSVGVVTNSVSNVWQADYHDDSSPDEFDLRYNYLNTCMSKPGIEVRYLTDMKRVLCERLFDICRDNEQVCPRIQNRYIHHKRHCHAPSTFGGKKGVENKETEMQVPLVMKNEAEFVGSCHGIEKPVTHKSCFCQTPQKCICKTKSETEIAPIPGTIEDMLMKLVPELNLNEPEDLPTLTENLVKEWVNQVPPFYNVDLSKEDKEQLMKNLTNELKNIDDKNADSVNAITLKCLRDIPALRDKSDSIIADMGENLINKIKYLTVQNEWQNNISDLVTHILSKYNLSEDNKKLITKAVTQKLKPIVVNRALPNPDFKGFLTDEILGLIQRLPLDVKDVTVMNAQNKSDEGKVQSTIEAKSKITAVEDTVMEWINLLPGLSNLPRSEAKTLINPLVETLVEQQNPEKINILVKDWLKNVANKDGTLSSRSINKLTEKLISKLARVEEQTSNKNKKSLALNNDNKNTKVKDTIMEWFQDIPNLKLRDTHDNKLAVQNLANRINEIISDKDVGEVGTEVRMEVSDWLKDIFKSNNLTISASNIDNLINNLVNKIKKEARSRTMVENDLKNVIKTWLTNLSYVNPNHMSKFVKFTESLADNLDDLQKNTHYDVTTLENELNDVVDIWGSKIKEETGINIRSTDKQQLLNTIMDLMQNKKRSNFSTSKSSKLKTQSYPRQIAPKSRKKWRKIKTPKQDIHDGVSKVINKYSSNYMNKTKADLINRITNEVEKRFNLIPRPDRAQTKAPISHILEDNTKFSSKDIDDIAGAVVDKVVGFSSALTEKSPSHKTITDSGNEVDNETANNDEDEDDNKPVPLKKHKLLKNIAHDISNSIDKYLGNGDEDKAYAYGPRATSTPEKELEASLDTLTIPSIYDDDRFAEINRVKGILREWLQDLNTSEDLKNEIIDELAEDILDRQKYLNISKTKIRKSVELEHLKFEVYKRLNKVISDEDLSNYMNQVESLAEKLNLFDTVCYACETAESVMYKQRLSVVISSSFPSCDDRSFNSFKDDLADAFVSLHFCTGNQTARNKYKNRIRQEISNFCCDYLIRYPSSHMDAKQINKELYIALLKVPVPDKKFLEPTHRISLIQEEICSWLNKTNPSILKSNHTKERVSDLAKTLYHMLKNETQTDNIEQKMIHTITEWLEDFCDSGKNVNVEFESKILLNNIRRAECVKPDNDQVKIHLTQHIDTNKPRRTDNATQYTPSIPPPSTLTAEEKSYLEKVRARCNAHKELRIHSNESHTKEASCNPIPMDISTQTGVTIDARSNVYRPMTSTQTTADKTVNVDIIPQVVVNEYHWDSVDSVEPSKMYNPQPKNNVQP